MPKKLVLDREAALHKGGGKPTDPFAAYLGQLNLGWVILAARDAEAKGALERNHRFIHGNFEAGRRFANPADFRHQLDLWLGRTNNRKHRTTKQVIDEHFKEEAASMRPLPKNLPDTDHRQVIRVPAQPYFRFDTNDYSLDPRLVGKRVELRASQGLDHRDRARNRQDGLPPPKKSSPAASPSPTRPTRTCSTR
ncbi:MAG: hypothetical protein IPK93_10325 [Solirubrobacterales bacterium]|nr:hypothetical protein [Solirubrobacterales bacterium]